MPNPTVRHAISDRYIYVNINNKVHNITSSHPNFAAVKACLEAKEYDRLAELVTVGTFIIRGTKRVTIEKGRVLYRGRAVDTTLTRFLLKIYAEGKDMTAWENFVENLYQNPSEECRNELYNFMALEEQKKARIVIEPDGCMILYKRLRSDYTDCHTGTVLNLPGTYISMPRDMTDQNYRVACSSGYHCCARTYLANFRGGDRYGRLVRVRVNPKDIVAAPVGDHKLRTWCYYVIDEIENLDYEDSDHPLFQTTVADIVKGDTTRKELLNLVLMHPDIVRALRNKKIARTTIEKSTTERLKAMAKGLKVEPTTAVNPLLGNPMKRLREEANMTIRQMADALGLKGVAGYKKLWALEKSDTPLQSWIDKVLKVIMKQGNTRAVVIPKTSMKAAAPARGAASESATETVTSTSVLDEEEKEASIAAVHPIDPEDEDSDEEDEFGEYEDDEEDEEDDE